VKVALAVLEGALTSAVDAGRVFEPVGPAAVVQVRAQQREHGRRHVAHHAITQDAHAPEAPEDAAYLRRAEPAHVAAAGLVRSVDAHPAAARHGRHKIGARLAQRRKGLVQGERGHAAFGGFGEVLKGVLEVDQGLARGSVVPAIGGGFEKAL